MESMRSIKIIVEVDTNKQTYFKTFESGDCETFQEVIDKANEYAQNFNK
jgi:hypothetical protein